MEKLLIKHGLNILSRVWRIILVLYAVSRDVFAMQMRRM